MHTLPDIRQLFRPVQPAIDQEQVSYQEQPPSLLLSKYIYCYWQLSSCGPLATPFIYRVVADGCIDLFFNTDTPEDFYIMGFSTTYTEFPLDNPFNYIGIRFLPAAFPLLFRIDAAELTNRFEALKTVAPALSKGLTQQVQTHQQLSSLQPLLDNYFGAILSQTFHEADSRFFDALDLILKAHGTLNLNTDLHTGISPRQLRRLFDFYIGSSPKTFSKVVRFQHILHAKPSARSLRENKLFYDAGYYDQAHFIKEFKTMYGLTPTIALR